MKKWLKIFIAVLATLVSAFILIMILVDILALDGTIELSDWLVAGCSVLSMIGTVSLAVISVTQNEKANEQNQTLVKQNEVANEQNQALIKQNEELQKINDTQFKIANQKYYPVLDVDNVTMKTGSDECPLLQNWECNFSKTINKELPIVYIDIDTRTSEEKDVSFYSQANFSIINVSDTLIQDIELYKLSASSPLNSAVDTKWDLTVFTLFKGKKINIEMKFRHNLEILITRHDALNFSIFLKIKTITNVTFYEKIRISATPSFSYGVIEKISDKHIDN